MKVMQRRKNLWYSLLMKIIFQFFVQHLQILLQDLVWLNIKLKIQKIHHLELNSGAIFFCLFLCHSNHLWRTVGRYDIVVVEVTHLNRHGSGSARKFQQVGRIGVMFVDDTVDIFRPRCITYILHYLIIDVGECTVLLCDVWFWLLHSLCDAFYAVLPVMLCYL